MKTRSIITLTPASWLRVLLAVAIAAAFAACSNKKNTAAHRNYQAFITRYNVYYNGDEHYKETLKEMERAYEDDYSGRMFMHPAEAYAVEGATRPSGSFERSIEKAQKAIQLHSIKKKPRRKPGKGNDPEYKKWLKRDEYNPFLHNAWMLMGRSQYFGGDFLGAASTFYYVAKHFTWLPATVTEAKLWQARSYCAMDWLYECETILTRIKQDELVSGRLRELYYFTYADFYIRSHKNDEAVPMLLEAVRYAKGSQKSRLWFILGRTYSDLGLKKEAYNAYKKAGASHGASYRTKFNARIRRSEVYDGQDITPEVKALKRMTRYGINREYLDQIYYAIGNLYLSRKDTLNAIANYELAAEKSTRNGVDKAISQVTLGGLYYDLGRYDKAQPAYSEGIPQLPKSYPGYERLKRRSDVLDELAVYSQNVVLNDSLLRLADMDSVSRMKVITRIIDELKKKEREAAEDAAREEYLAEQQANGSNLNDAGNAPTQFTLNTDNSWYFYNTATRNAGRTDFQKRWGSRKLEDNWRRRNKNTFDLSPSSDDDDTEGDDDAGDADSDEKDGKGKEKGPDPSTDPHFPEYYLKQIPKTEAERATAHEVIQEGLYNSGLILKDKLEDFPAATREWEQLQSRYPDNIYRLDIYYNEYFMNMRLGNPAEAERYRQLILSEFPDSKYAAAMADPNLIDKLRRMEAEQESLYEQTYEDYLANRNAAVHAACEKIERDYPMSPLIPKFLFLNALAYVTENNAIKFTETIRDLLERFPDTDISPIASAWLSGIGKGRELHSSATNARGMLWDIRLTNDSTATGPAGEIEFTLEPEEPHYLVLLFSTDALSPNQLLYEVARHNFSTYVVRDFDLEMMNFGRLGLLIVKGFANQGELNHYRQLLARDGTFSMPEAVRPVEISKSNFDKLLQGGGSFDDYFRFIGEETVRETHEATLPPDEYPSAAEMYAEPEAPEPSDTPEASDTPETPSDMPDPSDPSDKSDKSDPSEPALPEAAPQPAPEPKPAPKRAPAPAQQPAPQPAQQPKPAPLPSYPIGSEGDEED